MDNFKTALKYWNIFYAETVNSYGCMRLVLMEFFAQLTAEE